ncbi:hypothetical protein PAXRUDRAFT_143853 [Paxillus rubicundulus Ve08.2h10]|uniref:DASH complex subunit DAM1 n=1 Tax=Paxillus rubicundulus Ve08.2h10 TaxID=930991 RepID=A0A0D0DA66_9AGAM|nr:hypothetical protein PAXRUDRAFT_143853 [Paxillus rubicundulus Ve08.2h10]
MPNQTPHRTPLRRISQGSLFALSRSGQNPNAPHGLGFLEPVMSELVDEAEALHANVDGLRNLSESLRTFNESFASWLYVMDMNALTTDWPQEDARAAAEAVLKAAREIPAPPPPDTDADKTTYTEGADTTTITTTSSATKSGGPVPAKAKKKGKPKLSAKEKKERSIAIEKVISCLPLEFRGNDPNLRRNMEAVIEAMMDSDGRGIKLIELIVPPDLTQARVNKCLIALVNRRIVHKDSSTGSVLYHWHGLS